MANRFQVLDVSLELVVVLRPIVEHISRHDRDLANQLRRAATSVPSNISEGAQRTAKDRLHFYRIGAGSAAEVRTQLKVAIAWGAIEAPAVELALGLLDRILATLWKLTH